jgi:hypothetical protein
MPKYVDNHLDDNLGFRRSALAITNTTVAGTYNLVFTVDGLTRNVTLVINNATPKVFVLSGKTSATPGLISLPAANDAGTANDYSFSISGTTAQRIKFVDDGIGTGQINIGTDFSDNNYNDSDKFVSNVSNVYTIDMPSATADHILYGFVALADIPVGVYNYKVVKSYPDGRIETVEDSAQVTSLDANQIAVFGTATEAGVDNTKFKNNFIINEPNGVFEKGTYVYEFTFGTATAKYTINVVDRPTLSITSLAVGSSTTTKYGTGFTQQPPTTPYASAKVIINFTQSAVPANAFVSVAESTDGSNLFTVNADASGNSASDITKIALTGATSLELGVITGTPTTGQFVKVTLTLWQQVDYSVNSNRFVQIGETQVVAYAALAPVTIS